MRDTMQEALRQAINYHTTSMPMDTPKKATPEQIVATAKKFAAFLDEQKQRK